MSTALITHPSSERHQAPEGHPERAARVPAVVAGVESAGVPLLHIEAPEAPRRVLHLVHDPAYVDAIERFCESGGGALDPDTFASVESWEAALRSAGAALGGIEALDGGEVDSAFIATRPPGHHALRARAMGFCLFNNIAIAAAFLLEEGQRVAIVDWDVHHGNGTQDLFYEDPRLLYVSLHEFPAYPGTGWLDEDGAGPGAGSTINIPVPAGTAGDVYREAFRRIVVPVLGQFEPDWVLVSCGYDAHVADPLAGIALVADDYRAMASAVVGEAPPSRTVLFLEGGYDLEAIEASARATVIGLANGTGAGDLDAEASGTAKALLEHCVASASAHWEVVKP
jgi:acetoin utilization deacetylase AcuC-like enzyme